MPKEKILNLPNLLSFYRLISFPFVLYLVFAEMEILFAWMLCINLVTDILDGLIARIWKLETQFGAKLDSMADLGTYILAVIGLFTFKFQEIEPFLSLLWTFIGLILIYNLFSLIKFKRLPSLHLYSTKIGGYLQGIFFFTLFAFEFYPWFFILAMSWGYLSSIEEIIILLLLKQPASNAKGLYWLRKNDFFLTQK
jgi:CDP-diacylglycerol--glycerol-3-phosphate 3-phosphatidyltransferase